MQTDAATEKRNLPEGIKTQVIADHFKKVVLAVGVEPGRQSLRQLTDQAVARAKAASNVLDEAAKALAYLDGVIDSLSYAKPDDLKRAKRQAESAKRSLEIAVRMATPSPE